MSDGPTAMLRGSTVFRVVWLPGSDLLRGYCWCGTWRDSEDPVELWEWLVEHPSTHAGGPDDGPVRTPDLAPRADEPLVAARG